MRKHVYPSTFKQCPGCGKQMGRDSMLCWNCRYPPTVVTQPSDLFVKYIPLTQGQFAIVDTADYDWLMQWKWMARWSKCTKSFYAIRNEPLEDGRRITVLMHREILGLGYGDKMDVDHVETANTLDNRRVNLRSVSRSQNRYNSRLASNNTLGCKCLNYRKRSDRYEVSITVDGRTIYAGSDRSYAKAKSIYVEAVKRLHGEFARTA